MRQYEGGEQHSQNTSPRSIAPPRNNKFASSVSKSNSVVKPLRGYGQTSAADATTAAKSPRSKASPRDSRSLLQIGRAGDTSSLDGITQRSISNVARFQKIYKVKPGGKPGFNSNISIGPGGSPD